MDNAERRPLVLPETARWATTTVASGQVGQFSGMNAPVELAISRLIPWRDLALEGLGTHAIDALVAQGSLVRVRTGVYLPGDLARRLSRWDKDLVSVHAHALASRREPVFVGASAARLWGLDVWAVEQSVHVLESGPNRSNACGPKITCHHFNLMPNEVTMVRGLRVTTVERTVADCVRVFGLTQGVVLADSALRRGATPEGLSAALGTKTGTRGLRRARCILALADGRSESVAEGRMRMLLHSWGQPAPVLQYEVTTARHRYRLDMAWPEAGLALEVHGNSKYFRDVATAEKLVRERKREAELAEAGIAVLNVWWEQLEEPDLRSRIERHLAPLLRPPA